MALLNCGKVIALPTSQGKKVLKGHHTKHLLHFKAEEGLCVGNPILLTKIESSMATSLFLVLFRWLHITCYEYMYEIFYTIYRLIFINPRSYGHIEVQD